ncbi:unnamed protein product, partial [Ixodes hexagonus]
QELDGHDWYCSECHRGGDVLLCSSCHRVYHVVCVKEDLSSQERFVCSVCQLLQTKDDLKMKAEDLNMLLGYTCLRLKDKTKELHRLLSADGDGWRQRQLIYQRMDLATMEEKTRNGEYSALEEFRADAQTIVHNVVIFHGIHSCMADMARQMLRDCSYDLGEIRQCSACYRMSNEKRDKLWFCQPCDPPHDLVFAKQKGFPYWPAKVIRVDDHCYDVRFFGGYHQRALVDRSNIKPIGTSLKQIAAKRTTALNRALDELRRHQQLLERGAGGADAPPPRRGRGRPPRLVAPDPSASSSSSEDDREEDSEEEEAPSSSSPAKMARLKDESWSEDHNVVSSSCQESPSCRVSTSTQTPKKAVPGEEGMCQCGAGHALALSSLREQLEAQHAQERERLAQELREQVRAQCEAEKVREVGAALERMRGELEQHRVRDREAHEQELARLEERHRQEISDTKKKQWVSTSG